MMHVRQVRPDEVGLALAQDDLAASQSGEIDDVNIAKEGYNPSFSLEFG